MYGCWNAVKRNYTGGKFVSMYSLRDDSISINIDSTMSDAALHKAQQLDSALMKVI